MEISKTLKDEIADLVKIGEELTNAAEKSPDNLGAEQVSKCAAWVARVGQMIRRLYPAQSQHLMNYESCISHYMFDVMHSNYYRHLCVVTGIVKAVQHELEKGLLSDIRQLLRADIFADFFEMAEHLLKENYKDASAVIIGSVLEDSLRKLADANGIPIMNESGKMLTIDPLNNELAKAAVYSKLVQKQITSWADLRNSASHGHYERYDKKQVEMMLLFTQDFSSKYLG
jgi:hypothetical protein